MFDLKVFISFSILIWPERLQIIHVLIMIKVFIHMTSGITKAFPHFFQSRTDDKVIRFKRAVGYYSATSKPMPFHPPHYLGK